MQRESIRHSKKIGLEQKLKPKQKPVVLSDPGVNFIDKASNYFSIYR